jgi:ion channel-forming bestrophin family protein
MHAGRHYTMREVLMWTRKETLAFILIALVPFAINLLGGTLPPIPWPPIAALGIGVAFLTGFKGNAAYNRVWEARQIWGAIVNASRYWGVITRDFIRDASSDATHTRLVHRHIAWLTALRYQLRQPRVWESASKSANAEYQRRWFTIPEHVGKLEDDLAALLDKKDLERVLASKNRATSLMALQSADIEACSAQGRITEQRHVELARTIAVFYDQQGKCERIKSFPYPRQYATLNLIFVWMFILMLPLGVFTEMKKLGPGWMWLGVPLTSIIMWSFHTMDKVADATENPFEGGANDIPMAAISRTIEIDLRELVGEKDLPPPLRAAHNILM